MGCLETGIPLLFPATSWAEQEAGTVGASPFTERRSDRHLSVTARCIGHRKALHRPSQRGAMGYPAQCPWQAFLLLPLLRLTACRSGAHQPLFIKLVLKQLEQCPTQKTKEERQPYLLLSSFILVPGTGIEPVRPQWPRDFKSLVSTNSTIWATFSGHKGTPFARMPKGNGARKHNTCLKFPARAKSSDIFHVSKHKNASS